MKKNFLILFFFFFYQVSFANMIITNFDEKIKLTNYGREVETRVKVRISLDDNNKYYKEWKYIFDERLDVTVTEAKVIGKKYKTSFSKTNNELLFQFDNAVNGNIFEFVFKYRINNQDQLQYIRNEYVSLPSFANGAQGNLTVIIPNNLAVYSLNRKFIRNGNIYTWKGKIPNGGFADFFSLTLKKAKWQIELLSELIADNNLSNFEMVIPLYFKNGNNNIDYYKVEANYPSNYVQIVEDKDSIITSFRGVNNRFFQVKVNAFINNDYDNKVWVKLNPQEYLKIDQNLSYKLKNLSQNIMNNMKNDELFYVVLAQWVHNNIEYDLNYIGKDMTTEEILKIKKGVCIHYAQLYNDLLRSTGIPSVIVSGISYNTDTNKFENHAWNLVYTNGDWRAIDPTWGLYSGILPVSHIFLYFENRPVITYTTYGKSSTKFSSNIQKNINFIN